MLWERHVNGPVRLQKHQENAHKDGKLHRRLQENIEKIVKTQLTIP